MSQFELQLDSSQTSLPILEGGADRVRDILTTTALDLEKSGADIEKKMQPNAKLETQGFTSDEVLLNQFFQTDNRSQTSLNQPRDSFRTEPIGPDITPPPDEYKISEQDQRKVGSDAKDPNINKLIDDLDDDDFAVRNRAQKALTDSGMKALPAIAHRLEGKPASLEQLKRLQESAQSIAKTHNIHSNKEFLDMAAGSGDRALIGLIGRSAPEHLRDPGDSINKLFKFSDKASKHSVRDWKEIAQMANDLSNPVFSNWLQRVSQMPDAPKEIHEMQAKHKQNSYNPEDTRLLESAIQRQLGSAARVSDPQNLTPQERAKAQERSQSLFETALKNGKLDNQIFNEALSEYLKDASLPAARLERTLGTLKDVASKGVQEKDYDVAIGVLSHLRSALENNLPGANSDALKTAFRDVFASTEKGIDGQKNPKEARHNYSALLAEARQFGMAADDIRRLTEKRNRLLK